MITSITVNNITGSSPYDIYLCDYPETFCQIIASGVSSLPYTFTVPPSMSGYSIFELKVIDNNGCVTLNYLDCDNNTDCNLMPIYIGYDYVLDCWAPNTAMLSTQFHIKANQVLSGLLLPCVTGAYPSSNCPLANVDYSINGVGPNNMSSEIWGGGPGPLGNYVLSCDIDTAYIETYIDVSSYQGQTITVDYVVTYPSTPQLSFVQSLTVTVPNC